MTTGKTIALTRWTFVGRVMCLLFKILQNSVQFSSVQSLSHVWLFATPWTVAHQASLSIINSWSLLKLKLLCWWCHSTISYSILQFSSCLQSFPASRSFSKSQFFASGGQRIGVSASASLLPMNVLISFRIDWLDLLAVHGTLKSLLQHQDQLSLTQISSMLQTLKLNVCLLL